MNREKVLGALSVLGKSGAVCYVYRESVFELLSCGRVDGTLYLLSDLGQAKLKAVLEKSGYKDLIIPMHNRDMKKGLLNDILKKAELK